MADGAAASRICQYAQCTRAKGNGRPYFPETRLWPKLTNQAIGQLTCPISIGRTSLGPSRQAAREHAQELEMPGQSGSEQLITHGSRLPAVDLAGTSDNCTH